MRLSTGLKDVVSGILVGLWLVVSLPSPSLAHDPDTWFNPIGWDYHSDINYKIDDSIPGSDGSAFENRVHDGADEWNGIGGVNGFFYDDSGNGNRTWAAPCDWEDDAADIWFFSRDLGFFGAATLRCEVYHSQQGYTDVQAARIAFDNNSSSAWYTGTGNVPSGEAWVQELALHELGHATGVYRGGPNDAHWPAPASAECAGGGSEPDRTMCPITYAGHSYQQPLEPHDIDTVQNFY